MVGANLRPHISRAREACEAELKPSLQLSRAIFVNFRMPPVFARPALSTFSFHTAIFTFCLRLADPRMKCRDCSKLDLSFYQFLSSRL